MATQRPVGKGPTSTRSTNTRSTQAAAPGKTPVREHAQARDLGADTMIWHTRGLQTNSRMRAPVAQRTPTSQLPPSPVPRLILWAVLIGLALVCFQAVKHMLR
ncbi:hypothetical protein [Cupriavidus sp. BIS7]|uniref:hypothetical protein n=1 Tax=Cupriavidus sp. BIS7 TaxID=1217718 RepID=UPI000300E187|nr:hypothetical protein [Cupriavidus sp. BIS7]